MSQLTSVTGDDGLMWLVLIGLGVSDQLIQDWNHKHRGFSHTRFSLAENVLALQCMRNSINLNLTGMLETALSDSSLEFVLKEELIPACKVCPEFSLSNTFLIGLDLFLVFTVIRVVGDIHGL